MAKRSKVTEVDELWLSRNSRDIDKIVNEMTEQQRHQVKILGISHCGLSELPECISLLVNLKELYASDNNIKELFADVLCGLPLTYLDLNSNKLETFPHVKLPRLTNLDLRDNQLKTLSCTIKEYPLTQLWLGGNQFAAGCYTNACNEQDARWVLDRLEAVGRLVPLNWKPHSKTHMFVSDETHIEIKITMLVMKRVHIIRDLAHIISSYVAC